MCLPRKRAGGTEVQREHKKEEHRTKRLFAMLLAVAMCAGLICAPASAAPAEEPVEPVLTEPAQVVEIVPCAVPGEPDPNDVINLGASSDSRDFHDLHPGDHRCTYFWYITSTGQIRLTLNFTHSGTTTNYTRQLKVSVYRYAIAYDDGWNPHPTSTLVKSQTMSYNSQFSTTRYMTITGLSTTQKYFLVFENTSSASGGDITAEIDIND